MRKAIVSKAANGYIVRIEGEGLANLFNEPPKQVAKTLDEVKEILKGL